MGLIQQMLGNMSEVDPIKVSNELSPILIEQEQVHKAFKLHRDLIVMTNYRLITVDKQGVTGSKQAMTSIPYKSIRKFGKESAGLFDLDALMFTPLENSHLIGPDSPVIQRINSA
jgi:hypothetical protein